MRVARWIGLSVVVFLLLGCGKSRQLAQLLPDAPDGWTTGSTSNNDVSGVGHSSTRTYTPSNSASGVKQVSVQILLAEKDASQKALREMSIEKEGQFKEQKESAGYPAFESFPLPGNQTHSIDIMPKKGTYVQIVAYQGGPGWENADNRKAAVTAFLNKIDLKKIAAME